MKSVTAIMVLSAFFYALAASILPLQQSFIREWANTGDGIDPLTGKYYYKESSNCGPTSVLMVASYYSNTPPTPNQINQMDQWLYGQYGNSTEFKHYQLDHGNGDGTEPQ